MAKYTLFYNFDQWVDMIALLGEIKPPRNCRPGSSVGITVELNGVTAEKEGEQDVPTSRD